MLTFPEEFLLLAHDEKSGAFSYLGSSLMGVSLAGAALMDLALLNRIDTDPGQLILVDPTPTGEPILDYCLSRIAGAEAPMNVQGWIDRLAGSDDTLQQMALDRLLERGILRKEDKRFLWVFSNRVYPVIDDREITEVKKRISDLIFSDDIPDPRDIVLLSLAEASGLLSQIFTAAELDRRRPRIEQVARMDLIGRAVSEVIRDIRLAVMMSSSGAF